MHMQDYQHQHHPTLLPPPGHPCNTAVTGPVRTSIDDGLLGTLLTSDNGPLLKPQALRTMPGKDANAVSLLPTTGGVHGCSGVHIQNQSSDSEERADVGRLKTLLGPLLARDISPLLKPQALCDTLRTMQQAKDAADAHGVSLTTTAGVCGIQNQLPSGEQLQQRADVGRLKLLLEEKSIVINHLQDENERLRRALAQTNELRLLEEKSMLINQLHDGLANENERLRRALLDSRQEQSREIRSTTHSTETQPVTGMEVSGSFQSPGAQKQMPRRRLIVYQNRFVLKEEADLIRFWFERRFDYSIKSRSIWRLAVKKVIVVYCLPHAMPCYPV